MSIDIAANPYKQDFPLLAAVRPLGSSMSTSLTCRRCHVGAGIAFACSIVRVPIIRWPLPFLA